MPLTANAMDGTRVSFEDDGGTGTPVVILGGFLDPVGLVREAPISRALTERSSEFRLMFVDHRGHGRSGAPHEPASYAMPVRVADVVAAMDAAEIERANVVGISWGGRLGFGMGAIAPARLRSLVAIGQQPYAIRPDGPLATAVARAMADAERRGVAALVETFEAAAGRYPEEIRSIYLGSDVDALRAAWWCVRDEGPIGGDLRAWSTPCLICVAEDDKDFFEQARMAAAEIPRARFVAIPGTDHLGVDVAPVDTYLPAVLSLLREAI
ncbi:MAG: alpha/beta hydrolase [Actinomycetota bacterium]